MKKLITIVLLLASFSGRAQYVTTPVNHSLSYLQSYQYDIDNDQVDDINFYVGGQIIDHSVMSAYSLSDSIHLSPPEAYGSNFMFAPGDSATGFASSAILCWLWSGLVGINTTQYFGYYKKLSAVDSVFGYFTVKPCIGGVGLGLCIDDSLLIYTHYQSTTLNTPLFAGQVCDFEFKVQNDASCIPECVGSIESVILGGAPPFNYAWSNGETTPTIDSLCLGNYDVTITDSVGCVWQDSFQIDSANIISIFTLGGSAAPGCNSHISVAVTDGDPPFSYLWNTGSTNSSLYSLCSGWYTVTITDSSGCEQIDSILVPADSVFSSGFIGIPSGYTGGECGELIDCNGSKQIYISGGIPPYLVEASNGQSFTTYGTGYTFENLCNGIFSYSVTDSLGNVVTNSIIFTPYEGMLLDTLSLSMPSCSSCPDGSFEVVASNSSAPYLYSIDGGLTWQVSGMFTGLLPSVYEVCAQSVLGCIECMFVNLDTADCFAQSTLVENTCGNCNGLILIDPIGFLTTPTYLWSNGDTTGNIANLCEGNYSVFIEDSSGCSISLDFVIALPPFSLDTLYTTQQTCYQVCNASATISPSELGVGPYSFLVGNNLFTNTYGNLSPILCAGTFEIIGTDQNNCKDTSTLVVSAAQPIFADTTVFFNPTCHDSCNGEVLYEISNGGTLSTYSSSIGTASQWAPNLFHISDLCLGELIFQYSNTLGCLIVDTLLISDPDSLYFTFSQTSIVSCTACADGVAQLTTFGGTAPYTYDWGTLSSSTSDSANDLPGGSGLVCVTDANGCQFCDSLTVDFIDDVGFGEEQLAIQIHPNPASNTIQIISSSNLNSIELIDLNGKLVISFIPGNKKQISLDLSHLPNGMYLLKSQSEERIYFDKVVVQH